jgi:predicted HAD superfamily Cof-like phosphohydrolase
MPASPARLLHEFHRAFALPCRDTPGTPPRELAEMRQRLLDEETAELAEAVRSSELEKIAHELADVVYVAYGTALTYGIDLDAVIAEIHRSNLTKLDRDGRPGYRDDGKVARSDRYRPPDVAGVLHGWTRPVPTERRHRTAVTVRITDRSDVPALAALRRAWTEKQDGADWGDDGFEDRFAVWYAAEEPRRVCLDRRGRRPGSRHGQSRHLRADAEAWPSTEPLGIPGQRLHPRGVSGRRDRRAARLGFGSAHMLMARVRGSDDRPVH